MIDQKSGIGNHRVLVLGKRGGILQWPEHIIDACQNLRVDYKFIALNHNNNSDRLVRKLKRAFSADWAQRHLARQIEYVLKDWKPTVVILPDLQVPTGVVLKVLCEYSSTFYGVHWIGDFFPDSILSNNNFIDRFYFTDSHLVKAASELGLHEPSYLALAVNDKMFSKFAQPWEKRDSKILFVGAYSKDRCEILSGLNFPIRVYGKGWGGKLPANCEVNSYNIPLQKVAELYGNHKYVFNVLNRQNIVCGMNMRCYEATAAGALLLTEDTEDLGKNFTKSEVVTWAFEKNSQMLTFSRQLESSEVQKIARTGTEKTISHHRYSDRLVEILSAAN